MILVARVRCGNCGKVVGRVERPEEDDGHLTIRFRQRALASNAPDAKMATMQKSHTVHDPRRVMPEVAVAELDRVYPACGCFTNGFVDPEKLAHALNEFDRLRKPQPIVAKIDEP